MPTRIPHRASEGFASSTAPTHYPPALELEPTHRDMTLSLDLEGQALQGSLETTLRARRDTDALLTLHAVDLEITGVQDAQGQPIWHSYDGQTLKVRWQEAWRKQEERRLCITWSVERPEDGLFFSKPDQAEPGRPWFAATDHETERARHWLPCVDLPNVRTSLDIRLRAQARFTALANGLLVDTQDHEDGTRTSHWRLEQPCPSYLLCFVVGDLTCAQDGEFEGRQLAYYAASHRSPEELLRSFGRTREMMAWMVQRLGVDFPYPKYFQFGLPDFSGAMENISLVSWDDIFVLDETMAQEWTHLVDQINVHEMAHSYFGDMVVCRDYAHAWLKESWATYIEACWLEHAKGEDEARYDLYMDAQMYFSEADGSYQRPLVTRVFDSSWDLYDMHLYPGGACRLHTLRRELGEETFWAAVQDYLSTYAHRVVETDDFRRVMEEHSGRSLGRFFDQWVHAPGYPNLKVEFSYDDKKKVGTFEVEQTQADADKGVPDFHLNFELGWTSQGQQHLRPVELRKRKHVFTFSMEEDPAQVRVDPRGLALHKLDFNPGDTRLRAQLTGAQDVVGRIQAGKGLVNSGKRRNIKAVHQAYKGEAFWGVRAEWAKALGGSGTEAAIEALVQIMEREQDPMVLVSVVRACGKVRDPRVAQVLLARLDGGMPYLASQAAWAALGKQHSPPVDRLAQAARQQSFHGLVQVGALQGLAASRDPEAIAVMMEVSQPGAGAARARAQACQSLGQLARQLEERHHAPIQAHLVEKLRDRSLRVQMAAARGLVAMQAQGAASAMERWRAARSHQDQVTVGRMLDDLRGQAKPGHAALEKQLKEAREELRKLADRLEKLEASQEGDH
jgi:aminopeptidase N